MELEILDLDRASMKLYKDCFDQNDNPRDMRLIEWQFFQNKAKVITSIAYDPVAKKTAGIYASFSLRFKVDGKEHLACQALDAITDVNYRGKGLYTTLASSVFKKADEQNMLFTYGIPNANSIHGYRTKLAWAIMDPLPFLIKPLRTKYFTDKIKPLKFLPNINLSNPFAGKGVKKGFSIKKENVFPAAVNDIWDIFSEHIKVAVIRDKEYLDWRYIQKPLEQYNIAHCYDKDNKYLGFVVYAVKAKHNGKIAYIMELVYDLNIPDSGKELLKFAINDIKRQKADCILSWCFEHSPNYKVLNKAFFLNMPEKLRPIEMHFGAKIYSNELKDIIGNRSSWYISYSDSDTV